MTYEETKHQIILDRDRTELLNFLHACLAHATQTNNRAITNLCHRTLDKLERKALFMSVNLGA